MERAVPGRWQRLKNLFRLKGLFLPDDALALLSGNQAVCVGYQACSPVDAQSKALDPGPQATAAVDG